MDNFFLTILKTRKSKVQALADWVSDEDLLSGSNVAVVLLCLHTVDGRGKGVSLIKSLITFRRAPSS